MEKFVRRAEMPIAAKSISYELPIKHTNPERRFENSQKDTSAIFDLHNSKYHVPQNLLHRIVTQIKIFFPYFQTDSFLS